MVYLIVILRLIHIVGAIFWVGGVLLLNFFISPTVAASAEAGQKFIQVLMSRTRLSARIASAAGASMLAGILLYWIDSGGLRSAWTTSGSGIGFALGALFGLIGFVAGMVMSRNMRSLAELGTQIQGKPTAEQAAQLSSIRSRLAMLTPINSAALILAALLMATARYFTF